MAAYVPVIMFALLFGLSMDYEVFLISRMREAWVRTRDNSQAITTGLAGTGRVITAAAAIMIVVFAAIIPSDQVFIKVLRGRHGRGHPRGRDHHPDAARAGGDAPARPRQLVAAPRHGAAPASAAHRRTTRRVPRPSMTRSRPP